MSRNKNNLAILPVLISIAVLTFVCGSTESSPPPAPAPQTTAPTIANDQTDAASTTPLTQTTNDAPRVSITFNDNSSSSYELLQKTPPAAKPSAGPDLDVWYGDYFTDNKLPRLSASPLESEPSRLGVKLSFSF